MHPPIYAVCSVDPDVKDLLTQGEVIKFYPFGQARTPVSYPYAVWQIVGGSPFNSLSNRPNGDHFIVQVDVYGKNWSSVREVANALQYAIEGAAHVTDYNGEFIDPETKSHRVSFNCEWVIRRV